MSKDHIKLLVYFMSGQKVLVFYFISLGYILDSDLLNVSSKIQLDKNTL